MSSALSGQKMNDRLSHPRVADDWLADRILLNAVGSAAPSGLFLACPHGRAGARLCRQSLRQSLEAKGARAIYANLANPKAEQKDPGNIISRAIGDEVRRQCVLLLQGALDGGRWADFSPDAVGVGKEVSLTEALVALSMLWKVTIVLIIDEARFLITSEHASATMHALKAARDELNSSKHSGLRIVFMDVDKESLRQLCGSWDQPFYGSPMVELPYFR